MAILIESGVPILYVLDISESLVDNMVYGAVIRDVRDSVKEGKLLADCYGAKPRLLPSPRRVLWIHLSLSSGSCGSVTNPGMR